VTTAQETARPPERARRHERGERTANCRQSPQCSESTGPRSAAGKKPASRNATRHGLAAGLQESRSEYLTIEAHASAIAAAATGSATAACDPAILEHALAAARADRVLTRIRANKAMAMRALIVAGARPQGPPSDPSQTPGCGGPPPELSAPGTTPGRPASSPQRHTEMLHELTTLLKLDRYEKRARASRDRAILQIMAQHLWATAVRPRKRHSD
jgi:hypothetical protein